jgi:hypothetical protein
MIQIEAKLFTQSGEPVNNVSPGTLMDILEYTELVGHQLRIIKGPEEFMAWFPDCQNMYTVQLVYPTEAYRRYFDGRYRFGQIGTPFEYATITVDQIDIEMPAQ